jgi:hypothetical protein
MPGIRLFWSFALLAILLLAALSIPRMGATQELPPPANMRILGGPTYVPVGAAPFQSGPGSIAWFIATPAAGDPYAVHCNSIANQCYKIAFPK